MDKTAEPNDLTSNATAAIQELAHSIAAATSELDTKTLSTVEAIDRVESACKGLVAALRKMQEANQYH